MAENKIISIIIPVFNRESTLERLFASLRKITYRPLELILVDNDSKDNSLRLCQQFRAEQQTRGEITVTLAKEETPGACACRNTGIHLANGEFLYFFDSDDEISPSFFDEIAPFFDRYDMICAPTTMIFEDGKRKVRDCIPTAFPYDHIISASLSTQTMVIRKSLLLKVGKWDAELARWNDWELGARLLCAQPRLKWLADKPYHLIYQHAKSISGKPFAEDYENLLKSLKKVELNIKDSSLKEEIKIKSLNSLSSKALLLSASLYKDGNKHQAHEMSQYAATLSQTRTFKWLSPFIYCLSKYNARGMWRLYRKII